MSQVVYGNTLLKGINKAGHLKPDENGYYTVVLGALGVENSVGEVYVDTPTARSTFEQNSTLMRRIQKGFLKGEYGHPDPSQYPSMSALERRARMIKEERVSHHIASVWLDHIDYGGQRVLGILGRVKPCGPYGAVLKESLDNPEENVAFSGRYFSNVSRQGGRMLREIHTVTTWDFVSEPGVDMAQKYHSPSLEDFGSLSLQPEALIHEAEQEEDCELVMENGGVSARELVHDLGLRRTRQGEPKSFQW